MKLPLTPVLTASLVVAASSVQAQLGPGWYQKNRNNVNAPTTAPDPLAQYTPTAPPPSPRPLQPQGPVIAGNEADAITPEIQSLATGLLNDPKLIFDYVHNHIAYVHYFGCKKGATMTLLEGSGNDFDQCALLVALLRQAGYSPSYQFGFQAVPYESADGQDIMHWFGVPLPNTDLATTFNFLFRFFVLRNYPLRHDPRSGYDYTILRYFDNSPVFLRVWVVVNLGGTDYYLDPAFKTSTQVSGINLTSATGSSKTDIMNSAGGTVAPNGSDWVQNIQEGSLNTKLTAYTTSLLNSLRSQSPNASPDEVVGGWRINESEIQQFSTTTRFPIIVSSGLYNIPVQTWSAIPAVYFSTLEIQAGNIDRTLKFAELQGKRLSLTFASSQTQLWLDDSLQNTETG